MALDYAPPYFHVFYEEHDVPPIPPRMPWRVAVVEALPDFPLHVRFVGGTGGIVGLTALIHSYGVLINSIRN